MRRGMVGFGLLWAGLWTGVAAADPGENLVIDGTVTNACLHGINGAVLKVAPYKSTSTATGNLELVVTGAISVDATSRITAKGAGYRGLLCNDGESSSRNLMSGGRGGCSVRDSGGGGGHLGRGGKGTKDCNYDVDGTGPDTTLLCTFPREWEEDCGHLNAAATGCIDDTQSGAACWGGYNAGTYTSATLGDALPDVSGQSFWHHILDRDFGAAGGDKGCRDGFDGALRAGNGGGRIVLVAVNSNKTGSIQIDGRVSSDGFRGCASGNDSAGGGAGGSVLILGDIVTVTDKARVSAHGGRGGDSQPKCLSCAVTADCGGTGQTCATVTDPASGATHGLCQPCNCTPCTTDAQCDATLGQTCKNLGGSLGNVCADTSNACSPYDLGDDERECKSTQNSGTCDDCAGGGGGGIIAIQSRSSSIAPEAIFDVRGAAGGICPICSGEAGGGAGELQLDGAYVGELCDGYDNDFNGLDDDGLPALNCPEGVKPSCVGGVPQTCSEVVGCANPSVDARPRFALIVDTSGSMLYDQSGYPTFGDGSADHPGLQTPTNPSRLYMAKQAVSQVLSAFPESDYALGRYYQDAGENRSCQSAANFECAMSCCSYDDPRDNTAPVYPTYYPDTKCVLSNLYQPAGGYSAPSPGVAELNTNISVGWESSTTECINYAGSCGPPRRGAQFLVGFERPLNDYLSWLDHEETNFLGTTVEDSHCAGGDCELRGTGPTPLAASLQSAKDYLTPRVHCDEAIPCRQYSVILLTDGVESCQGDPVAAAAALNAGVLGPLGQTVPIKTYVIGFSVLPSEQAALDAVALAGGTNEAYFASNESELANALATIVASGFVYEVCNGLDDDCDGLVDEDFPDLGNPCDDGLLGICRGTGHRVCRADQTGTECLVTEPGAATDTEVCNGLDDNCDGFVDEAPLDCRGCVPVPEICNGIDDDCNGVADDSTTDVGQPCGISTGECSPGTTVCVAGVLGCSGAGLPTTEQCDGLDNNCDGLVDQLQQTCYTGAAITLGVGVCVAGTQSCPNGTWSACLGQVVPTAEVCNGLDDDCNGTIDDAVPTGVGGAVTGDACCPTGVPCGHGACQTGIWQCNGTAIACGGAIGPSIELCNGIDDDCNDVTDDGIPGIGAPCDKDGCSGTLQCSGTGLECQTTGTAALELCNGVDDNCNGSVDELPDIIDNDPTGQLGTACGVPVAPNDQPPCTAGTWTCVNGASSCIGEVPPGTEACNLADDDCDGQVDEPGSCPNTDDACVDGVCVQPCRGGEFPCPGGFDCRAGRCIPTNCATVVCPGGSHCVDGGCVTDGTGGSAGGGGGAGVGGRAGNAGATGQGASAGSSGVGAAGTAANGGGSAAHSGAGGAGAGTAKGTWVLPTGGGGCSCRTTGARTGSGWWLLLAVAGLGALRSRRSR
jgi:MYXO-CTERM domain-containing protein